MLKATRLSFNILESEDCKTLLFQDTSFYSSDQTVANATLQIISPYDEDPVELNYYKNAVTVLNSNSLKITNVNDTDYLSVLPDGLYTAKISICPEDVYWFEKSWYRTCNLQCKYWKAFLKLNVSECKACFSPEKLKKLESAKFYMEACKANVKNCNNKEADKMYKASNKILDFLLDCDC